MSRNVLAVSKIAPANFDPKKAIALMPENEKQVALGVLYGRADKLVTRTAPNGSDVFEGAGGLFEYVPADETKDVLRAGVLWLPGGIDEIVLTPLREAAEKGEKIAINLAFEMGIMRATNPQGYSWTMRPLLGESAVKPEDDPLSLIRSQVDKARAALPAPAKVATKK